MPDPRAAKAHDIVRAARATFGRDGYARASIDTIAAEAQVSTRTIYNHYAGKEELFASVLEASATEVADGFEAHVAAGVGSATGMEQVLLAIGRAVAAQAVDFPAHFAMVRHIRTEAAHFPPEVLERWRDAGPRRVQTEVARQLALLADAGLLRRRDPVRAARHFTALVVAELDDWPVPPNEPRTARQLTARIRAAVAAFLDGYRA